MKYLQPPSSFAEQSGAAILAAMVTVTIVASLATAAVMQQWKLVEVESAERHRIQAQWLLRGAVDWSRLLLRQDQQSSGLVDHLAEPWAVPLQETKVSMFLSAQNGVNDGEASADMTQAFLSGEMQDLNAKLNIMNMVFDPQGMHALHLQRLFERLGLPQAEFQRLQEGLQRASTATNGDMRPLLPQTLEDLQWLGVSQQSIGVLSPYVTVLPVATSINLNTAPALVIWAVNEQMEWSKAQALVSARAQNHFTALKDAQRIVGEPQLSDKYMTVRSQNFRAIGRVRVDDLGLSMQADLRRQGTSISVQRIQTVAGVTSDGASQAQRASGTLLH